LVKNIFKVLVCPLDWGMGHATRCVPIIRQLLKEHCEVVIAADGQPYEFLKEYFPQLEFIRLPGYRVSYPTGSRMILKMMLQAPFILLNISREHRRINKVIKDMKPDAVVSDNRFGLWTKRTYSIYMTHQVMIKAPGRWKWAEPLLYRFHRWFINRYDECWIPDLPGDSNMSGDLSHKYPLSQNTSYIGLLSRFENPYKSPNRPIVQSPNLLILLSGPEPQRTIFENIILDEINLHRGLHVVILQGLPGKQVEHYPIPGVAVFNHLPDKEIEKLILLSGVIICRPGYSTLMDLAALGRSAIVVPTPGQTEQEYLAERLSRSGQFVSMEQDKFDLGIALQQGFQLQAEISLFKGESLLENNINDLLEKLKSRGMFTAGTLRR
jgi:predicted glycosyltransferase